MNKSTVFLVICWALYDLANQFFALNIISVYFPLWLTSQRGAPEIFYSIAFGASMVIVGICAPLLGTISDMQNSRKPFLRFFTIVSVVFTGALAASPNVAWGLVCFAIANVGCQMAVVFYNAMLVNVAPSSHIGVVSGLGRMFAYSGALLAMYVSKPIIARWGYEATFLITGACFFIFALPALLFIPESGAQKHIRIASYLTKERVVQIFARIKATLSAYHPFGHLRTFLVMMFFGFCAVNAMILFMSVYATQVFGLDESQLIDLIVFSTFFAIVSSLVSGWIGDAVGYRRALIGAFFLWFASFLTGAVLRQPFHWLVGALIGMSLGATLVIARAWIIKLIPPENLGEIFGLFNLAGYLAGIVGPLFWGGLLMLLSPLGVVRYRIALGGLMIFIIAAFVCLLRIPPDRARASQHA